MNLTDELFQIAILLEKSKIEYAICGGLAVVIHGYPRLTRDIAIMISELDLDQTRDVLKDLGFTLSSGILPFDVGKPTEQRVFRLNKAQGNELLTLDLVLVTPFLEDVWSDRELHLIDGKRVSVVSRSGLAKMKRAAGRAQDLIDLSTLGLDDE